MAVQRCQGGTSCDVQTGQWSATAVKRFQGGTARQVQAGQLIESAAQECQSGTARDVQAGQLIIIAYKRCYIASNGDSLAGEGVIIILVRWGRLFNAIDGEIAIRPDSQSDCFSDFLGSSHGDDTFGEEGAARQQRAEEDEEPDA